MSCFRRAPLFGLLIVSALAACTPTPNPSDGGPSDGGPSDVDGGAAADAGGPDAGARDGGPVDAGGGEDAGTDAGAPSDDAGPRGCGFDGGCPQNATCTLPEGGDGTLSWCAYEPVPWVNTCTDGGVSDPSNECCVDDDCAPLSDGGPAGRCYAFEVDYCGGAAPPAINTCRYDECQTDEGCAEGEACVLAGSFGLVENRCVPADCRSDGDCTEGSGGLCQNLWGGGCGWLGGFRCTYDDDECRDGSDCTGTYDTCGWGGADAGAVCIENPPAP